MSTKSNKALIRRYFKAIDTGDVSVLEKYVSPAFVDHDPSAGQPPDREGLKQSFLSSQDALPGYHTVDELIAEGDTVVARVTGYGTHEGTYRGVPATGRKVRMSGIVIWRIRGGKIVERWSASHTEDLMRQIQAPRRARK
jgi:steroid delta-isomerase-like uncharacterized protein